MPRIDSKLCLRVFLGAVTGTVLLCGALACIETRALPAAERPAPGAPQMSGPDAAVPGLERASSPLRALTWNLEWFQDATRGPDDDARQFAVARDVLAEQAAALVALQEVASEPAFERLLRELPELAGILSGYSWVQKTALLWSRDRFEVSYARAIAGLDDAGRPPLEVLLRSRADGGELLVVVIHAKADAAAASYDQRVAFAAGLKQHLDTEHPSSDLIVLGDFNDTLVGSLLDGEPSPYRAFLDDRAYLAPTREFGRGDPGESSYAYGAGVDHIVLSATLAYALAPHCAHVLRDVLLRRYPDFVASVSDHFPVVIELQM